MYKKIVLFLLILLLLSSCSKKKDPQDLIDSQIHNILTEAYLFSTTNESEKVLELLNKAYKLDPTNPSVIKTFSEYYQSHAGFYYMNEEFDKANSSLKKAQQFDEGITIEECVAHYKVYSEVFTKYNEGQEEQRREENRQNESNEAISNNDDFIINYNSGLKFYNNKDYEQAITFFSKAYEVDRDSEKCKNALRESYYSLGVVNNNNKDYEQAIIFFNKAYEVDPNSEKCRKALEDSSFKNKYSLGVESYNNKDYEQAIALFNKALDVDPNSEKCKEALGSCYYNLGVNSYNNKDLENAKLFFKNAMDFGEVLDEDLKNKLNL